MIQQLEELRAAMAKHGIDVVLEAQKLNPPCTWAGASMVQSWGMDGTPINVTVEIILIEPDVNMLQAMHNLAPRTEALVSALLAEGYSIEDIDLRESITLPSIPAPLPAYRITTYA